MSSTLETATIPSTLETTYPFTSLSKEGQNNSRNCDSNDNGDSMSFCSPSPKQHYAPINASSIFC